MGVLRRVAIEVGVVIGSGVIVVGPGGGGEYGTGYIRHIEERQYKLHCYINSQSMHSINTCSRSGVHILCHSQSRGSSMVWFRQSTMPSQREEL